jgi:hypothetical protein
VLGTNLRANATEWGINVQTQHTLGATLRKFDRERAQAASEIENMGLRHVQVQTNPIPEF